jgi:hypothetical protein
MLYAGDGLGVFVAKFENPLTIPWDFENETVKLNSDRFADFKKRAYPLVVSFLEEVIEADEDSPSPLSYWFAHGLADEIWDADYDSVLCTEWGHPQVVLQSMKQAIQKDFLTA